MIHEETFKKAEFSGAKGLVFLGDKIITYRRDHKTDLHPGCIDLPGGGSENGESPFETFQREAMEEFGIHIDQSDIASSYRLSSLVHPGTKSFFIVTKPLNIQSKDIVFGNEGTEWILMTPQEFLKRTDGIERQQKRVEKYLKGEMISE